MESFIDNILNEITSINPNAVEFLESLTKQESLDHPFNFIQKTGMDAIPICNFLIEINNQMAIPNGLFREKFVERYCNEVFGNSFDNAYSEDLLHDLNQVIFEGNIELTKKVFNKEYYRFKLI